MIVFGLLRGLGRLADRSAEKGVPSRRNRGNLEGHGYKELDGFQPVLLEKAVEIRVRGRA